MAGVKAMAMHGSSNQEYSYAHNSCLQNHNFHAIAKPRLEKAVAHLCMNMLQAQQAAAGSASTSSSTARRSHVAIADLGCSYGRNTLDCALFILQSLRHYYSASRHSITTHMAAGRPPADDDDEDHQAQLVVQGGLEAAQQLDHEAEEEMPEVQYFFADLPSNDFNALFHALQPHLQQSCTTTTSAPPSATSSSCKLYAAGVPGSFHGRLFPSSSVDFVICSYSLHWLSQVPPSIMDRSSPCWNGGHAWIHKSTQAVLNAYTLQAKTDLKSFIQSRAYELTSGGVLFLFLAGSPNGCSLAHHDPIWEIFDLAWIKIVEEGIITLDEMEMFNMPIYFLTQREIEDVLMEAPEYKILHIETLEDSSNQQNLTMQQWLAFLTSVTRPTVETYLGTCKATKLYDKLKGIASEIENFSTRFSHSLVVVSLQRL